MAIQLPRRVARDLVSAGSAYGAIDDVIKALRPDWITEMSNFNGDALTANWVAAKTNGTSAAVTVASSKLTMTTGTDDDGYAGQGFSLLWKGDNGVYFQSIHALDTLTTSKIEVGLTDATDDAGAVATKATPTDTADDFCVLVRDTDDNTELDLISTIDNGTCTANAENVFTVVAATNFNTEFVAQVDSVGVFVNGKHVGAGSMQGGDLVTPWWFAQSRAGTASRIFTVEWFICTGPSGVTAPW